jgi:hypothetical protein
MIRNSSKVITPFLISPKGERMKSFGAPSPMGEGWEGGNFSEKGKFYSIKISIQ